MSYTKPSDKFFALFALAQHTTKHPTSVRAKKDYISAHFKNCIQPHIDSVYGAYTTKVIGMRWLMKYSCYVRKGF